MPCSTLIRIVLISDLIKQDMGGMDVGVLMGANLANEVAEGAFSESTIGVLNLRLHFRLMLI
jgi:glycerol-3-phosphate dehydrogenase